MLNLGLAVACSLGIGVIFKLARAAQIDRWGLLTVNYVVAAAIALAAGGAGMAVTRIDVPFLLVAVGEGVMFILSFALFAAATEKAGLALSSATSRLSVVIPFAASWLVWFDEPTNLQAAGFFVALGAVILLANRNSRDRAVPDERAGKMLLLALFVAAGVTDTTLKLYEEVFAVAHSRQHFMLIIFVTAFVTGVGLMVVRRGRHHWRSGRTAAAGVLLGLLNYGSVEFFLAALGELPGTVAFPANHVSIVCGATLLGVAIWREPLSTRNWAGIFLSLMALVFLTS